MKIEIDKGMSLWLAIEKAQSVCLEGCREYVEFIFNDVLLRVYKYSSENDIAEIYRLKRKCGECIK